MDPAVKAAGELNAIFGRLEVPCEVCVTDAEGKHVKATTALAAGVALVEEIPIVSWPSAHLVSLNVPFCFHCLRLSSHQLPASASDAAPTLPDAWSGCAQCSSSFCSPTCQQACGRLHRLLCASLATLRAEEDLAHGATGTKRDAAAASGITLEALARCVGWIVQRLSAVVEQQKLTHEALQTDYVLQQQQHPQSTGGATSAAPSSTWSTASLNYQLFTQVVTPFSRLISPPDNAEFDGISLPAWVSAVRRALADRCVKVLLMASGANLAAVKLQQVPLTYDADATRSPLWAEALVQVVLSTDTLRTLVGQMVLNAHAINDYLLPAPTGASEVESTSADAPAALGRFDWILKGAGLYALLACFNHSCAPNAAVSNVGGTHEIGLQTTRPVAAGAPLTITYIPVDAETSTPATRRQQLKNYFFTCRCPRCTEEEKQQGLASAAAASA